MPKGTAGGCPGMSAEVFTESESQQHRGTGSEGRAAVAKIGTAEGNSTTRHNTVILRMRVYVASSEASCGTATSRPLVRQHAPQWQPRRRPAACPPPCQRS